MSKKVIIIIIVAVVVIAAAIGAYLIFSGSDYSKYSKAFDNTFDTDSMEFDTKVIAELDDGTRITSTGNFRIKGMDTNPQFINTMNIDGQTVTQFSDGDFIYTDDGMNRNKMSIGGDPTPKQDERESADYSIDAYISEFSGLIDASKIRQISALEAVAERYVDKIESESVSGGTKFIVTLLPQAVDELVENFLSENLSNQSMSPTVDIFAVTYSATVVSDYVTEIAFSIDMDVTAPNSNTVERVTVDLYINPVNPGRSVSFDLPSTDGF